MRSGTTDPVVLGDEATFSMRIEDGAPQRCILNKTSRAWRLWPLGWRRSAEFGCVDLRCLKTTERVILIEEIARLRVRLRREGQNL